MRITSLRSYDAHARIACHANRPGADACTSGTGHGWRLLATRGYRRPSRPPRSLAGDATIGEMTWLVCPMPSESSPLLPGPHRRADRAIGSGRRRHVAPSPPSCPTAITLFPAALGLRRVLSAQALLLGVRCVGYLDPAHRSSVPTSSRSRAQLDYANRPWPSPCAPCCCTRRPPPAVARSTGRGPASALSAVTRALFGRDEP